MEDERKKQIKSEVFFTAIVLTATVAVSLLVKLIFRKEPFLSIPIFIIGVVLTARSTEGYWYGVTVAIIGTLLLGFFFSGDKMFSFGVWGYLMILLSMIGVSVIISNMSNQLKSQERIHYEAENEKMRANLLRSISHDLRTPLASIMGSTSTLVENKDLPNEDRDDLLREINKDARWLVRVMENLLSVTRFSENVELKKSDEVVEEIVGSAIVKFKKHHSLRIIVNKPEEILLVPMDGMLIQQVLINLLENVVAHSKTATQAWIVIKKGMGRVIFFVEDNGTGIPKMYLNSIFKGYISKINKDVPDDRRNMGIGLSVCKTIILAHGGDMTAYNNSYGGATFKFWLPCEKENDKE